MGTTRYLAALLLLCAGCEDSVPSREDAGVCAQDGGCESGFDASPPPGQTFTPDAAPPDGPPPVISCDGAPQPEVEPGLNGLVPQLRLQIGRAHV